MRERHEVSDNDDNDDSSVPSSTDDDEEDAVADADGQRRIDRDDTPEYSWSDEENEKDPTKGQKVDKEVIDDNNNGPVSLEESESLQIAQTNLPNDDDDDDDDDEDDVSTSDEKETGYAWSDSDSDSDDSTTNNNNQSKYFDYSASKHDDLDEFASEFNDNAFSSLKYGEITYADEHDPDFTEEPFSLEDDVGMNLDMVTKIFPELLGAKPELFDERGEKAKSAAPAGWDAAGLMQRYDPTAVTATSFEVKIDVVEKIETKADVAVDVDTYATPGNDSLMEQAEEGASDSDPDSSSSSSDDDDDDGDDAETKPEKMVKEKSSTVAPASKEVETKEQIYEQKKLENIFQQERTSRGTTGFQMSSLFDKSVIVSKPQAESNGGGGGNGGSFSFGFIPDVPQEEKANAEADKLNAEVADAKINTNEDVSVSVRKETMKILDEVTEPDTPKLKQRRGMTFGNEELEVYTTQFFNANEGIDAILASLGGNASDEVDKEKWDEERKVLTMDWKRKQNNAVSKQKKRIKIR